MVKIKRRSRPDMIGNQWNKGKIPWNKGLTKETDARVVKNGIGISESRKGKTYEEIYGKDKSEIMKEMRSKQWKGFKRSESNKKKCSISKMGDLNPSKRPEVRKKMSITAKRITNTIEGKKKCSLGGIAALKAVNKCPNKFEERALAYLEILYPRRFSYTGNGTCIINGKSADAVDLENRTVALFNGVYWHLKRKGLEITEENKRLRERIEAEPFNEAGYRVIFLWEDEI